MRRMKFRHILHLTVSVLLTCCIRYHYCRRHYFDSLTAFPHAVLRSRPPAAIDMLIRRSLSPYFTSLSVRFHTSASQKFSPSQRTTFADHEERACSSSFPCNDTPILRNSCPSLALVRGCSQLMHSGVVNSVLA